MISNLLLERIGAPIPYDDFAQQRRSQLAKLLSQTFMSERIALYLLGAFYYRGIGSVLDLGTAAGGSSYCIAAGLLDNEKHPDGKLSGYDLFAGYSLRAFEKDIKDIGLTFDNDLALFDWQTEPVNNAIDRFQVNLNESPESISQHGPAEIVHIDAAKSLSLWRSIFGQIANLIIPGHTIWVFQDFERARLPFQLYAIGALLEYGEIIGGAYMGTVYFIFEKQLDQGIIHRISNDDFSVDEKLELIAGVFNKIRDICPDILGSFEYIEDVEHMALSYVYLLEGDQKNAKSKFDLASDSFKAEPANRVYEEEIKAGRCLY